MALGRGDGAAREGTGRPDWLWVLAPAFRAGAQQRPHLSRRLPKACRRKAVDIQPVFPKSSRGGGSPSLDGTEREERAQQGGLRRKFATSADQQFEERPRRLASATRKGMPQARILGASNSSAPVLARQSTGC